MPVIPLTARDGIKFWLNPDDITRIEPGTGKSVVYRRGVATPDICLEDAGQVAHLINKTRPEKEA